MPWINTKQIFALAWNSSLGPKFSAVRADSVLNKLLSKGYIPCWGVLPLPWDTLTPPWFITASGSFGLTQAKNGSCFCPDRESWKVNFPPGWARGRTPASPARKAPGLTRAGKFGCPLESKDSCCFASFHLLCCLGFLALSFHLQRISHNAFGTYVQFENILYVWNETHFSLVK